MARGEDFVFETDYARYVVASNELSKSLLEKKTGREWLLPKPTAFAQVKKDEGPSRRWPSRTRSCGTPRLPSAMPG